MIWVASAALALVSATPDRCAIIEPYDMGRGGGNCQRPPTRRGVWRFEAGPKRILLCDHHAVEYGDHERLTLSNSSKG